MLQCLKAQHWCKKEKHAYREPVGQREAWECAECLHTNSEKTFLTLSFILKCLSQICGPWQQIERWCFGEVHSDQEYSIDMLMMKACDLRNERCLRHHLPCSTNWKYFRNWMPSKNQSGKIILLSSVLRVHTEKIAWKEEEWRWTFNSRLERASRNGIWCRILVFR